MDNFFACSSEKCFGRTKQGSQCLLNIKKTMNVYGMHAVLIIKLKHRRGMLKSKLGYIFDCQVCICCVLKTYCHFFAVQLHLVQLKWATQPVYMGHMYWCQKRHPYMWPIYTDVQNDNCIYERMYSSYIQAVYMGSVFHALNLLIASK